MLKTQITGAKYLSPQTNQMTNLNIAVPADSKDTKFGTSDILLAKDVAAYYYTKEETDNLILIAKNSAINIHNEDNTKSIKLDINDAEAYVDYDSPVNVNLTDTNGEGIVNINATDGFRHTFDVYDSNLYYNGLDVTDKSYNANISAGLIFIYNSDIDGSIGIYANNGHPNSSPINISLTDGDYGANIDAKNGFRHSDVNGCYSNLRSTNLDINNGTHAASTCADYIYMHNSDESSNIEITTNKELTEEEQKDGYSQVDISLADGDYSADINAEHGFMHKTDDGFSTTIKGDTITVEDMLQLGMMMSCRGINMYPNNREYVWLTLGKEMGDYIKIGKDQNFKISRPNDTEGGVISGIKSLTAFTNPSATKVWATDGSTIDLTTKANASDVLLKKSASGGYYIELNSNALGSKAFAANDTCTASGSYSFAEGGHIEAIGYYSHAEGVSTKAIGDGSHAEGNTTKAEGAYAHAEGETTQALGNYSHAEGQGTVASNDYSHAEGGHTEAKYGSHAEGYYTHAVGTYTHAEGEYTSASGACSHAEGFNTYSPGYTSHSEGNGTKASGYCSHALGIYNVDNVHAIHSVGIGNNTTGKNAEYIYVKNNERGTSQIDDPKNGYKYLIGVGGYDGINTDNTTYKSVQEVIADLTSRIEQLETKVRALEAANTPA